MAETFLTIDDLTDYLGSLPDWYVQVLEAREQNACDVCPEDEIEIELTDFAGQPISGEPWFVFMESTNGSAVSRVNGEVDPFLNGAGQTTPSPLILNPGADVVDVAFGSETVITLNLTDDELGEEYQEQLYIVDTPATYEGPLAVPSDLIGAMTAGLDALNDVYDAREAGVPGDAIADMLAEIDLAVRAGVGLYEDLSLTARNDAEARLMLAMQGCPADYHKHPDVTPRYEDAEQVFNDLALGTFVGPDGVSYSDPTVARLRSGIDTETNDWMSLATTLELTGDWDYYIGTPGRNTGPGVIERIFNGIFSIFVSAAEASPQRLGGPRGSLSRSGGARIRGKGSNPKRKPTGRNGTKAHTQTHTRRLVRSNKKVKVKGAKIDVKEANRHFFQGDGVRTNGQISGGHTTATYARDLAASGGRHLSSTPHPHAQGIFSNRYQPRRQSGSMTGQPPSSAAGQFARAQTKTVVDLSIRGRIQILRDMREALRNGVLGPNFQPNAANNNIIGTTKSGISMRFHITGHGNGRYTVRSYYHEF